MLFIISWYLSFRNKNKLKKMFPVRVPSFFHAPAISVQRLIFWLMTRTGKSKNILRVTWTHDLCYDSEQLPWAKAVCLLHDDLGFSF